MSTIFRIFNYIQRYLGLATVTIICALLVTSLVAVFPSVTQIIIDKAIRGNRPDLIVPLSLLAVGSFFFQELVNYFRWILNSTFQQKVVRDLRNDLYQHIQCLPIAWFDQHATGDIMTRLIEDVNAAERVIVEGIELGSITLLQIVVVLILMFGSDPALAWLALVPLPFLVVGALSYTLTAPNRYRGQRCAASAMNSLLHDNLAGIRQIKSYVCEENEYRRFSDASRRIANASVIVVRAIGIYGPSMSFLNNLGFVIVTGFGGMEAACGELALGKLVAFLMLVRFLYEPVARLHTLNELLQAGRAAGERIFEIMDAEAEVDEGSLQPNRIVGRIEYRGVWFNYEKTRPALQNINFVVEHGQKVALVGQTGAGKSTVVKLLLRFHEVTRGQILLDGHSLREYSKRALRQAIGYVTQESFLFNGSIQDNLLLGKHDCSKEEIEFAIHAANALDFIKRLPDGLDTQVGERGTRLSVGEKQRLSIARAILKDPPILVLDEATANVDTKTEHQIQTALNHLLQGRTSFVIAHRLSTVRDADEILVFDRGQIVERGQHDRLIELDGKYAELCQRGLFSRDSEVRGEQGLTTATLFTKGCIVCEKFH